MPDTKQIETIFASSVGCPPEAIWRALTATNVPRSWMWDSSLRGSLAEGSDYAMYDDDSNLIVGTVLASEAPYRLVLSFDPQWDATVSTEPAGILEYLITPTGAEQSQFTVRISGLSGSSAGAMERNTAGIYSQLTAWLEAEGF